MAPIMANQVNQLQQTEFEILEQPLTARYCRYWHLLPVQCSNNMAGHSLKFMLFFSIIVLATAICPLTGNDRGTFTATSGNFRVDWWRPTDSTVSFNVSVTTANDTWGAIGFSNDQLMVICLQGVEH